jgi:voltage-gated potassium channel
MRRRASKMLKRRDSSILHNPIELEENIPVDVLNSHFKSKRRFKLATVVRKTTSWYIRSNVMRMVVVIASLVSCALFVINSYDKYTGPTSQTVMDSIDIVIFVIFALDYIFNILYSTSKLSYMGSFTGLVDLASLCSIINIFVAKTDLSFLPLLRLLRNFKLLRMFQLSMYINVDDPQPLSPSEAIAFETASLAGGIVIAWFLTASVLFCIIQQDAEAFTYNSDASFDIQTDITLFDCIYIVLVLISTLGFGDFSPNNFFGRLFVIVVMILTLTIIPAQVGQLVERMGKNAKYMNDVSAFIYSDDIILMSIYFV